MKSLRPVAGLVLVAALVAVPIAIVLRPRAELPHLYPMPAFSLTSEQGERFDGARVAGKVTVANFIFTRCPTVCPTLTAQMAKLQERFADEEGVHLLSFSVDPRNDTPRVLAEYGRRHGQDPRRWTFLTGDLASVENAVVEGFKIHMDGAADPEVSVMDIVHGEHFVLVDRRGTIRGYYDPRVEFDRLVDDVERLLEED